MENTFSSRALFEVERNDEKATDFGLVFGVYSSQKFFSDRCGQPVSQVRMYDFAAVESELAVALELETQHRCKCRRHNDFANRPRLGWTPHRARDLREFPRESAVS